MSKTPSEVLVMSAEMVSVALTKYSKEFKQDNFVPFNRHNKNILYDKSLGHDGFREACRSLNDKFGVLPVLDLAIIPVEIPVSIYVFKAIKDSLTISGGKFTTRNSNYENYIIEPSNAQAWLAAASRLSADSGDYGRFLINAIDSGLENVKAINSLSNSLCKMLEVEYLVLPILAARSTIAATEGDKSSFYEEMNYYEKIIPMINVELLDNGYPINHLAHDIHIERYLWVDRNACSAGFPSMVNRTETDNEVK